MENRLAKYHDKGGQQEHASTAPSDAPDPAGPLQRAFGRLESYITEYPKLSIGVGLSLGVLVGWLVKRR